MTDPKEILDIFGKHFSTIGSRIVLSKYRQESHSTDFLVDDEAPNSFDFSEIAPQEVKRHIMKLKQSFSLDDFGFSTQIMK